MSKEQWAVGKEHKLIPFTNSLILSFNHLPDHFKFHLVLGQKLIIPGQGVGITFRS